MDQDKIIITKKSGLKGEDGHKVLSIRIKDESVAGLDELAVKTGHSRNALIGIFIEYGLEHYSIKE
jgi:predicted DNA-binding protein